MDLAMEQYLEATPIIDCESTSIKGRAQSLTIKLQTVPEKAKSIFYFVRDEIKYNPFLRKLLIEDFQASTVLDRREGYCVQKAVLLAALARASGIPARLRFADIQSYLRLHRLRKLLGTNLLPYHGYNELYIEGRWLQADATLDLRTCQKQRIPPVEFDATKNARLHSHSPHGKLLIEYIRDHGHYQDVPLGTIMDAWNQAWGAEVTELFRKGDILI